MFATNSTTSELHQTSNTISNNNNSSSQFSSSPLNPPSCIVIGCKNGNGISNANVKYYQVPFIHTNNTTTTICQTISRQWYINTLREDLLEYVNTQRYISASPPIHFVCIEHFDEESFITTTTTTATPTATDVNQESELGMGIVILKEDAVPSLFEFDVFQKMIAHQERFTLNQQHKQQMANASRLQALTQASQNQQQQQSPLRSSLLSNLILNDGMTNNNSNSFQDSLKTSQKNLKAFSSTNSHLNDGNISTAGSSASSSPITQHKRTRIDPEERAALMQRVPKAVKRTSVISHQTLANNTSSTQPLKMQKAMKHTMSRSSQNSEYHHQPTAAYSSPQLTIINDIAPSASPSTLIHINNNNNNTNSNTNIIIADLTEESITPVTSSNGKFQKAVKHTSNIFARDSSSPQLTTNLHKTSSGSNKAVKHTGGGSNSYYQNKSSLNINNNRYSQELVKSTPTNSNRTPMLTSLVTGVSPTSSQTNTNLNNKITITTTYVYKRVLTQPEIDLNLECEEEEIVYIVESPKPPSPLPESMDAVEENKEEIKISDVVIEPSLNDETVNNCNHEVLEPVEPNEINPSNVSLEEKSKLVDEMKKDLKISKKIEEVKVTEENEINNVTTDKDPIIETKKLENEEENLDGKSKSSLIVESNNVDASKKLNDKKRPSQSSSLNAKVVNEITNLDLTEKKSTIKSKTQLPNEKISQKTNKPKEMKKISTKANDEQLDSKNHLLLFTKYYSRRQGALAAALDESSSSLTTNNKRSKLSSTSTVLPADLRIGKYPAKCTVCDLILDNNIELTSHICSHLESNGNTNDLNTYISPFDAVTTTCGICELTFAQPFELIEHLDAKHMKQLDEFKCRICERQHTKQVELLTHLKETHSHQEMPYRCDACGFRTSFYADAIYHIKKEHTSTLRHFCPYCLKSLALPFNKKLGYVQCNLFYSHLVTHFNKHENDVLMPSKCKHCSKCILHVRFMKDHLTYDHNDLEGEDSDEEEEDMKIKQQQKAPIVSTESNSEAVKKFNLRNRNNIKEPSIYRGNNSNSEATETECRKSGRNTKQLKPKRETMVAAKEEIENDEAVKKFNLRKRRRSKYNEEIDDDIEEEELVEENNIEGEKKTELDVKENRTNSNEQTRRGRKRKANNIKKSNDDYDAADEDEEEDEDERNNNETEKSEVKQEKKLAKEELKPKAKAGRKPSVKNEPKPQQKQELSSKLLEIKTESTEFKQDLTLSTTTLSTLVELPETEKMSNEILAASLESLANTVATASSKRGGGGGSVIKQRELKKLPPGTRRPYRHRTTSQETDSNPKTLSPEAAPTSVISSIIFGNIRLEFIKNEFKCIECGETDFKTHYKKDYTCHQCFYNTACSKAFEFHLHGHLDKKRVALWNKPVKTSTELYKCPCGFKINSSVDNNDNANTGNKVASHLLSCNFKYCKFSNGEEETNGKEKMVETTYKAADVSDSDNTTDPIV